MTWNRMLLTGERLRAEIFKWCRGMACRSGGAASLEDFSTILYQVSEQSAGGVTWLSVRVHCTIGPRRGWPLPAILHRLQEAGSSMFQLNPYTIQSRSCATWQWPAWFVCSDTLLKHGVFTQSDIAGIRDCIECANRNPAPSQALCPDLRVSGSKHTPHRIRAPSKPDRRVRGRQKRTRALLP